jgi:hypothetical protein
MSLGPPVQEPAVPLASLRAAVVLAAMVGVLVAVQSGVLAMPERRIRAWSRERLAQLARPTALVVRRSQVLVEPLAMLGLLEATAWRVQPVLVAIP